MNKVNYRKNQRYEKNKLDECPYYLERHKLLSNNLHIIVTWF